MKVRNDTAEASLYERIGGYDVIAAVIDDLFALMRGDPDLHVLEWGAASIHADELSS
jgi:truncated hemoglobin YjbI